MPKYAKISGVMYESTDSVYRNYSINVNWVNKKKLVSIEQKYSKHIIRSSLKYKIPKELIIAIVYIESSPDLNPLAVGSHGEMGLMQIKPSTAGLNEKNKKILFDPATNIDIGSKLLAQILKESIDNGSIVRFDKVAIRYNAGYSSYNKCKDFHNLNIVLSSNIKTVTRNYVLMLVGKNGILETLSKINTNNKLTI